jgi:E3 Ubiquitin ligase
MSGVWLFGAGVSTAATLALAWWARSLSRQNAVMTRLSTSRAGDIARLPPGAHVELKGALRCLQPLQAEFTGTACVWYRSRIEELRAKTNSDNPSDTETVEVYRSERWAQCEIEDASGSVMLVGQITKAGATIEGTEVRNAKATSFPSSASQLAMKVLSGSTFRHTQIEHVLTPNVDVYVLATVLSGGGVGPDANGRNLFLVSTRSEEQRAAGNASVAKWAGRCAIAAACLAVWLLYQWWLRR